VISCRPYSVAIFLSAFFKSTVLQLLEFVVDVVIVIVDDDAGEKGIVIQF
jgi:hypothetical protein